MLEEEGPHPKSHSPSKGYEQVLLSLGQHRDKHLVLACAIHVKNLCW